MRRLVLLCSLLLLVPLSACHGGDDAQPTRSATSGGAAPARSPEQPCDVTTPTVVADVMGGRVADGVPGTTRNCSYAITGGAVSDVEVYLYGQAKDWEQIKANYARNRGPVTPVLGVGTSAFNPGDFQKNEIVVVGGDTVFAVGLGGVPTAETVPQVQELAARIADDLEQEVLAPSS